MDPVQVVVHGLEGQCYVYTGRRVYLQIETGTFSNKTKAFKDGSMKVERTGRILFSHNIKEV